MKDPSLKVSETIKSSFTLIPEDADLKAYNSEYQQKHSQSPSHLQSVYNVRYILDNSTKEQNEKDLQKTLELPSITMQQALTGLSYLDLWKSNEKTKTAYREAAMKKWPEASVFQTS